jgi:hypothetical protein
MDISILAWLSSLDPYWPLTPSSARQKKHVRFTSKCMLYSLCQLPPPVSYFPFVSIKKVVPYVRVLREGYYVIIWLIDRM